MQKTSEQGILIMLMPSLVRATLQQSLDLIKLTPVKPGQEAYHSRRDPAREPPPRCFEAAEAPVIPQVCLANAQYKKALEALG